jgi:hypothetical protein
VPNIACQALMLKGAKPADRATIMEWEVALAGTQRN